MKIRDVGIANQSVMLDGSCQRYVEGGHSSFIDLRISSMDLKLGQRYSHMPSVSLHK